MKTIIEGRTVDSRAIHQILQKGYGTTHPERIAGYDAFFMSYGDIIVSDDMAYAMDHNEEFKCFVFTCIREFQNDKYAHISHNDYDCNVEDKWLAGGGDLFARYAYNWKAIGDRRAPQAFIKFRKHKDNTYILFDSEPDWIIKEYLKGTLQ